VCAKRLISRLDTRFQGRLRLKSPQKWTLWRINGARVVVGSGSECSIASHSGLTSRVSPLGTTEFVLSEQLHLYGMFCLQQAPFLFWPSPASRAVLGSAPLTSNAADVLGTHRLHGTLAAVAARV